MQERNREELHAKLVEILGSENVYYQVPTKPLCYPCIVYDKEKFDLNFADNKIYRNYTKYSIKYMHTSKTRTAEGILGKLLGLEYCSLSNRYTNDGVCHDVFTLYY